MCVRVHIWPNAANPASSGEGLTPTHSTDFENRGARSLSYAFSLEYRKWAFQRNESRDGPKRISVEADSLEGIGKFIEQVGSVRVKWRSHGAVGKERRQGLRR
ncbi:hypothetical protein RUM43_001324 [Polyplax serrata]|uniref:Uncharacterized protein n=1 Tax=Polyplax serrata TaxID=468196 RepID=A0AAN8SDN3_POLSC